MGLGFLLVDDLMGAKIILVLKRVQKKLSNPNGPSEPFPIGLTTKVMANLVGKPMGRGALFELCGLGCMGYAWLTVDEGLKSGF